MPFMTVERLCGSPDGGFGPGSDARPGVASLHGRRACEWPREFEHLVEVLRMATDRFGWAAADRAGAGTGDRAGAGTGDRAGERTDMLRGRGLAVGLEKDGRVAACAGVRGWTPTAGSRSRAW